MSVAPHPPGHFVGQRTVLRLAASASRAEVASGRAGRQRCGTRGAEVAGSADCMVVPAPDSSDHACVSTWGGTTGNAASGPILFCVALVVPDGQ